METKDIDTFIWFFCRSIKSLKENKENTEIEFPEFGLLTSLYFVGVDKSTGNIYFL